MYHKRINTYRLVTEDGLAIESCIEWNDVMSFTDNINGASVYVNGSNVEFSLVEPPTGFTVVVANNIPKSGCLHHGDIFYLQSLDGNFLSIDESSGMVQINASPTELSFNSLTTMKDPISVNARKAL
eukprot:Awhi_evm1s8321